MKFRPLISILLISSIILLATGCGGGGGGGAAAGDGFAVNYIVNGAESGAGPVGQYSHGEEVTISDNTGNLAKAGYLFDGWNTKADGTGKDYAPGAKYKGDELFLYAKWAPIYLYDIVDVGLPAPALDGVQKSPGDGVLSLRGLAPAGTRLSVFNIPSAIDGITVKYIASAAFQNNINMISVTLPETLAVIGGSSFQGCINLTSLVLLGTTPPTLAGGALDGCPVTVAVPLSAVDTYKAAGGWDFYSASIVGYTDEPHTVYTVTFDDQGATTHVTPATKIVESPATTVGSLPTAPEKTFCTFGGWYTQTGGAGDEFTAGTTVTSNITVYAKWTLDNMVAIPGKTFKMLRTEVTQALYTTVIGSNPSHFIGDSLPVECVNWYDAVAFCNALSTYVGLTPVYTINGNDVTQDTSKSGFRLPTREEWEYAAAGGEAYTYAGSNTIGDVAWYNGNSSGTTHTVGSKAANGYGLYDMSGNVLEWCWDVRESDGYRTQMGGHYNSDDGVCAVNYGGPSDPNSRSQYKGFRIVCKQ